MARNHPDPTPAVEQAIVAYVRGGGYPHVAAEAAGMSRDAFEDWLRRGEGEGASDRLRAFAGAVRQAHAQARLAAEVAVFTDKPLDWLRSGPGRDAPDSPGWTGTVRPRPPAAGRETALLLDPEMQAFVAALLRSLETYPEARASAVAALPKEAAG
jgi:hypothetical protein